MSNSTYGQKKLRTKIASQQGTLVMARNALQASIEITQQRDALLEFYRAIWCHSVQTLIAEYNPVDAQRLNDAVNKLTQAGL